MWLSDQGFDSYQRSVATLLCCLVGLTTGCGGSSSGSAPPVSSPAPLPPTATGPVVEHVKFSEISVAAGLDYLHGFKDINDSSEAVAGVAVGDYDNDGWLDLYIAQGDTGVNLLYRNLSQDGNYRFEEVARTAGVAMTVVDKTSGPAFADYDGDGDVDLFVGGIDYNQFKVFRNNADGTFTDVTLVSGLTSIERENNISVTFADYDQDADLDLFIAHWTFSRNELPPGSPQHLWQNDGSGFFTDVSEGTLMASAVILGDNDFSFTPNFADIDNDLDLDVLLVADNDTSQVILNNGDLGAGQYTFTNTTDVDVITDEAGMGSSVADFDHDGDLDWFVSSIQEVGNDLRTGNRFYENTGGAFIDSTVKAGIRNGYWGWASCAADFNNDGHLDIFHVNGISQDAEEFLDDPSRLFFGNGALNFTELSEDVGLIDRKQGRGVVCFDGDQDGDIDIFIANNNDTPGLFRNDGGNELNYLNIKLSGPSPNTEAIGARLYVVSGGYTQMRAVANGNNYVSQNPAEQHIGMNELTVAASVRIVWPDGSETERSDIAVNQRILVTYPDTWSTDVSD